MNTDSTSRVPPDPQTGRGGFSRELHALEEKSAGRPLSLLEILEATQGRGFDLLLICISLPFVTPIPLPGLSTPFGLVVSVIGARLAIGRKPWLPQSLLQRKLPPRFLSKLLRAACRIVRVLEFFLKPRMALVHEYFIFRRLAGALIMMSGLLLLLPLPVPFSNFFPAATVVLLAAGALERDGLFFFGGCVMFGLSVSYFSLLAFGGVHAIEKIQQALGAG